MRASRRESSRGRQRARAMKTGQRNPPPPPLTPDQAQAADRIRACLAQGEGTAVLGGYAGTGKTFTVTALLKGHPLVHGTGTAHPVVTNTAPETLP